MMVPVTARSRTAIAASMLLAALSVTGPAAAGAPSTYTVQSCRDAQGVPLSSRAWLGDREDPRASDRCAEGGPLEVVAGTTGRLSGLWFAAPAGTQVVGYRIHLTAATGLAPGRLSLEAGIGEGSLPLLPPVSAGCPSPGCSFGNDDEPASEKNLVTKGGIAAGALALVARCGGACGWFAVDGEHGLAPPSGPVARARLWRSAVDVADALAPSLGAAGGSLLAGQPVSGRVSVTAFAGDEGGGVADVVLRVDGVERSRVTACAEPFTLPAPCPAALPVSIEFDTGELADGQHLAELVATDAAGNSASSGPLAFRSSNTPAAPGSGTSAGGSGDPVAAPVATALLRAGIELSATKFRLPASGRRIEGLVRRVDGAPAAGARLVLRSRRFGVGAPRARVVRELRTGADGRFAFPLPSVPRRLTVELDDDAYRSAVSDEVLAYGRLRIAVQALGRNLRNGSTMLLLTRIAGAGGSDAAAGRVLLVQALVDGRWTTVDSVETGPKGAAGWRYRFRATSRTTRYRFRVRAPRGGDDWPWPATSSRSVSVLVKP